jgi:hypothetical protein
MTNEYPGVRGPIISAERRDRLDRFRAFRHRVRNSYGGVLDAGIVEERASELASTLAILRAEFAASFAGWEPRRRSNTTRQAG